MSLRDKIEWVETSLVVDSYQAFRDDSIVLTAKTEFADGWDTRKVPPLLVSVDTGRRADGSLYDSYRVLDGHHRFSAAKASGLKSVPFVNVSRLTPAERAALTRSLNAYRKRHGRSRTDGKVQGLGGIVTGSKIFRR